ncbi:hypothetical protein F2Q68_00032200 [Brassica cretica]|uniref:Uncharacterized protein n=1 Tax=Brassica cretica TaxID=69181 RepID=A0A8S9GDL8_BRACR|nr:hypothetical protein F2Q68_00032200 [Brassica cretica]
MINFFSCVSEGSRHPQSSDWQRRNQISIDTVHLTSIDTAHLTSIDTVHLTSIDTDHPTSIDTVHLTSIDTAHPKSIDTANPTSIDTVHPPFDTTCLEPEKAEGAVVPDVIDVAVTKNFDMNLEWYYWGSVNPFRGLPHEDPRDLIKELEELASAGEQNEVFVDHIICKIFPYSLFGDAFSWFSQLQPRSLTCWEELRPPRFIELHRRVRCLDMDEDRPTIERRSMLWYERRSILRIESRSMLWMLIELNLTVERSPSIAINLMRLCSSALKRLSVDRCYGMSVDRFYGLSVDRCYGVSVDRHFLRQALSI